MVLSAEIPIVEDLSFAYPKVVPWGLIIGGSAGGIVLALVVAMLIRTMVRRRRERLLKTAPQRRAFGDLEAAWRCWHSAGYLAFLFQATQIIRVYLEARFAMAAPTRTTEEILRDAAEPGSPLEAAARQMLDALLRRCDALKFAALPTVAGEVDQLYQAARSFVIATAWRR